MAPLEGIVPAPFLELDYDIDAKFASNLMKIGAN